MNYKEVRSFESSVSWLAKQKLSDFQNAENKLEDAMYPWTVGFMTRQKLHHLFLDSAENAFSGHQNAENELIQRYVPLNRGFHVSEKSHLQVSKMKKIYSNLEKYPWTVGYTTQ